MEVKIKILKALDVMSDAKYKIFKEKFEKMFPKEMNKQ